ncbi:MAG: hypothetical protein CVV22_02230 [Ignavibacteriae bacterium HGW-Ignavibacteriae-1]|nr:MAG: hypothetical protein CVV22_02230 [Ignavibacteriae bacterium HGW-Ignavibacteriae-1]
MIEDEELTLLAPTQVFWDNLSAMCGKSFEGRLDSDSAKDPDVAGKILIMNVRKCSENEIKVPFVVGEDKSRTWIFTKIGDRLQLKHDHRHEDGSEDDTNFYGGMTSNAGRDTLQMFIADQETVDMLDFAAFNVWMVELLANKHFAYSLRRIGTDRHFRVVFDLTKEVPAPKAIWGWVD